MNNIPYEAKSLRWLENMFPFIENAKDNIDKMSNAIHVYCKAGADCIEANTKELEKYRKLGTVEELEIAIQGMKEKKAIVKICRGIEFYHCPECDEPISAIARYCSRCGCKVKIER